MDVSDIDNSFWKNISYENQVHKILSEKLDASEGSFKTLGFKVVKNIISRDVAKFAKTQFYMLRDATYFTHNANPEINNHFYDELVHNAFSYYCGAVTETLLVHLQDTIEKVVDKELFPTFSYGRILYKDSFLEKHTDRESCEYSATICIDRDDGELYSIFIEDYAGKTHEVKLDVGDALIYHGTKLKHWREKYEGKEHLQMFIHYVDKNGDYASYKFDNRPMLGLCPIHPVS